MTEQVYFNYNPFHLTRLDYYKEFLKIYKKHISK